MTQIFLALLAAAAVSQTAFGAATNSAPAKPVPSRSVFVMPDNPRAGRDPFYPESLRPYETGGPATNAVAPVIGLTFNGILGTPGHYVAVINNHSFMVGDVSEVRFEGGTASIHCLEIFANRAVVEVNGQKRELNLEEKAPWQPHPEKL